jgi:hypothetical protein
VGVLSVSWRASYKNTTVAMLLFVTEGLVAFRNGKCGVSQQKIFHGYQSVSRISELRGDSKAKPVLL